jgi:hypothetical protein
MILQTLNLVLNLVIVGWFVWISWGRLTKKKFSKENINIDDMSWLTTPRAFSSSGKSTPKINDDEAAYRKEKKLDLKDENH